MPNNYPVINGIVHLTPFAERILLAQLRDGADTETVARRVGCATSTANSTLTAIAKPLGMSRLELVVGFIRGDLQYAVVRR